MRGGKVVSRFEVCGKPAVIRYAKRGDFEGALELGRDNQRYLAGLGLKRQRVNKAMRDWWRAQVVIGKGAERVALFLEIAGKIQGVIIVARSGKKALAFAPWWVHLIGIASKYRGMGLGRMLMPAGLSEAKKVLKTRKIGLSVATTNLRAVKLYVDNGFHKAGVKKKHREFEGELVDWLQMVKRM